MRGLNPLKKYPSLGNATVPFGGKTTQENFHPGVDVAGEKGTPIPATVGGVVTKADTGHVQGENNFGNTLEIKDQDGNLHQYHHLQGIKAKPGQTVQPGEEVATLGNTGATYSQSGKGDGSNLDYRIVAAYTGKYKDPTPYIEKYV